MVIAWERKLCTLSCDTIFKGKRIYDRDPKCFDMGKWFSKVKKVTNEEHGKYWNNKARVLPLSLKCDICGHLFLSVSTLSVCDWTVVNMTTDVNRLDNHEKQISWSYKTERSVVFQKPHLFRAWNVLRPIKSDSNMCVFYPIQWRCGVQVIFIVIILIWLLQPEFIYNLNKSEH